MTKVGFFHSQSEENIDQAHLLELKELNRQLEIFADLGTFLDPKRPEYLLLMLTLNRTITAREDIILKIAGNIKSVEDYIRKRFIF